MEAGGGHTAVRAIEANAFFNANTGEHSIESKTPLEPLDVTIKEPNRTLSLKGNVFSINEHFDDIRALYDIIESLYFVLPALLNIEFADPPIIERVDGIVGDSHFRWQLSKWEGHFRTTTQDQQEKAVIRSWERLNSLAEPNRRLLAAIHYFHVACRLARCGSTPGEFLPEVLLNLAKTLEVLFPPSGDGKTRDAVRIKLKELGYKEDEIEGKFIPAIALRNEIDVGHVSLCIFNPEQLKILHSFAENAEESFRELFVRVFDNVSSGMFQIVPYEVEVAGPEARKIIDRIQQFMRL
ncbi:MAG: hypothetical protein A4E49_00007 [Methanosaeta sp. PtaU1.Bin112]|nr:MAG: hypothetical protein A4E49_00007 [Methanosaeta sp. PtaU1.Bin112]